jgi:transposase
MMRKTLYCGVDLHSNNAMYVITDEKDKQLLRNACRTIAVVLKTLLLQRTAKVVAVESTYNWYWLVDALMEHDYPVVLAHPSEMEQYDGIKEADDLTDAAFLARLARLGVLPTGYIYPKADRPVRDLLRRRTLLVQQRTGIVLSLQNMALRQSGQAVGWRALRKLSVEERAQLLGDHDCLTFVTAEQVDLIERFNEKIRRFEQKVLEHAQVRPAYACLQTLPGVGTILALTMMLETGEIGRFHTVGDYTSYCRCVRATHSSNGKKKAHNNAKNGNPYLAWAFVEAVHHALRTSQAKSFYDKKRPSIAGVTDQGVGGQVE